MSKQGNEVSLLATLVISHYHLKYRTSAHHVVSAGQEDLYSISCFQNQDVKKAFMLRDDAADDIHLVPAG